MAIGRVDNRACGRACARVVAPRTEPLEDRAMTDIAHAGVIGAGTMGSSIAQACAVAGIDVVMLDIDDAALQRGMTAVGASLDRLVKKEKLTPDAKAQALGRIKTTTDYAALKAADLVIEAATENVEIKLKAL